MKRLILGLTLSASSIQLFAQPLTEITNKRIWEHHSSAINGGSPFGMDANGAQAGYNFVTHSHYTSFDPATFGPLTPAQRANLDLVEHNGLFGNGGNFGFTSGMSSIWNGDIQGNGLTKYFLAPTSFNYDTLTNVASIRNAYDSVAATNAISAVIANRVYLARVRNTNMYVAMKITNVKNLPPGFQNGDTASVFFDFNYKHGTYVPTGGGACIQPTSISIANTSATAVTLNWSLVSGATGYEHANSTSATPPASGTLVTGATATYSNLIAGNTYYAHVRTKCGTSFSPWKTQSYTKPTTSVNSLSDDATPTLLAIPNPVSQVLTVQVGDFNPDRYATLALMDISGRVLRHTVVSGKQAIINVEGLPAGVYMLRYTDTQQTGALRIQKL